MSNSKFAKVDCSTAVEENPTTNWSKCIFCQENKKKEGLSDPSKTKQKTSCDDIYDSLAARITGFHELGRVPLNFDYDRFSEGSPLNDKLKKNCAVWHHTCYSQFSDFRLQKERARDEKRKSKEGEGSTVSPVKTRRLNPVQVSESCIFGNCPQNAGDLVKIEFVSTSNYIKDSAKFLKDTKLMAKCEGAHDLMSLTAGVYHLMCYVAFRNKVRAKKRAELSRRNENVDELQEEALNGLIAYIFSVRQERGKIAPVFSLKELGNKFAEGMKELGAACDINPTRLKERILLKCPDLVATGCQGRETCLAFRDDVDNTIRALSVPDLKVEEINLHCAAKAVRNDIFCHSHENSWNNFTPGSQFKCVPESLLKLVKMIIDGPDSVPEKWDDCPNESGIIVSSIAQLIYFNTVRKRTVGTSENRAEHSSVRHDKLRETSVPVFNSLRIHGRTRSKRLINSQSKHGLGISYRRVQSIIEDTCKKVCAIYKRDGVVCPRSLHLFRFTTGATDNLNHTPSSTTAKDAFNGTAVSWTQHPSRTRPGEARHYPEFIGTFRDEGQNIDLPSDYAIVQPCYLSSKAAKCPTVSFDLPSILECEEPIDGEKEWLEASHQSSFETCKSWASHHAEIERERERLVCNTAVAPLFKEPADSLSMMLHAMRVNAACIKHVNPGQTSVIVVDQPLFALCKTIQFLLPELYGEDKYVVMMGGLHIEMNALKLVGSILEKSGWEEALFEAKITTIGRAESMLKGSHVARTRYCHEVTCLALYSLQQDAYDLYIAEEEGEPLPFDEWRALKIRTVPQFRFWNLVFELELLILQFVRSQRSANFQLYKDSLRRLITWCFALDHTNYARWGSVHLRDMLLLDQTCPDVAIEFRAGKFVGRKTARPFSAISLDQVHEQINAELKDKSGIIGLTESKESLKKWLIAGPELADMVDKYDTCFLGKKTESEDFHHSEGKSAQIQFREHVKSLKLVFKDNGDPFLEESDDLYNLSTKKVAPQAVLQTLEKIEELGENQYQKFVSQRLLSQEINILDTIKKNSLPLFRNSMKKHASASSLTAKLVSAKNDCSLFSRLYIACKHRNGNLGDFFKHENQPFPPSLSNQGEMRTTKKSDLLQCLIDSSASCATKSAPPADALIVDGAALIHILKPGLSKTFSEYVDTIFMTNLFREIQKVTRIDFVWDQYLPMSLKAEARRRRGEGDRTHVLLSAKIPAGWANFLRVPENKADLFRLLARAVQKLEIEGKQVYSTLDDDVVTSSTSPLDSLRPCNHEEADSRLLLHAAAAASQGFKSVLIRTVDTDVSVIAVASYGKLPSGTQLWLSIGTGRSHQFIAVHEIAAALGPQKSLALPAFHALTGCDTTSSFNGKGKVKAWETWKSIPEVTEGFKAMCEGYLDGVSPIIEKFVIALYDRASQETLVDNCRQTLFTKKNRQIANIPPTANALAQHTLRASLQAQIWAQSLKPYIVHPDPEKWGWKKVAGYWKPYWTTLPEASKACRELIRCGCKSCVPSRCSCKKENLNCSELCSCPCNLSEDEDGSLTD